jgi:hypothetical protein
MSKTRILRALRIVGASALAGTVGCSSAGSAAPNTPDAGGPDVQPQPVPDAGSEAEAGPSYTRIDDMEGTTDHIEWTPPVGVGGSWLTTTDSAQFGSISPIGCDPPTCKFSMWSYAPVPTPYETFPGITSRHAARLRTTQPLVNTWGANMTFAFARQVDAGLGSGVPPLLVDLSKYTGVTFWAMAAQNLDTATIAFLLNDKNTVPFGGACADADGGTANCFSAFRTALDLTGTFKQYTIDFSTLAQASWGFHPVPDVLDLQHVSLLSFQVDTPGGASSTSSLSFDVWIDDLYFINK